MKIFGRLTIYGEYLMHNTTYGYIEKSNLYLTTVDNLTSPVHPRYEVSKDEIFHSVSVWDANMKPGMRGDLPIGYGLASSSIMAFIYLFPLYGAQAFSRIMHLDNLIHGFEPSGVDISFCYRQKKGLYKNGRWEDILHPKLNSSLVLFPKEKKVPLSDVRKKVLHKENKMMALADAMSNAISTQNYIPYDFLQAYANELDACDVYSKQVSSFIKYLASKGIVAKGVGGLYDKAVLIIWPYHITGLFKANMIREILKWNPLQFIEFS